MKQQPTTQDAVAFAIETLNGEIKKLNYDMGYNSHLAIYTKNHEMKTTYAERFNNCVERVLMLEIAIEFLQNKILQEITWNITTTCHSQT